ncbi:MAG: C40 family peptidase [Clostridium sp.]|nr:C40 family peptidase [Clostridium sp.]MCM1173388.1 C40 family peptidase [Clostridium sp.]MCM1209857.1 C40 family peptidase [Ruminococcus sp.]
MRKTCRTWIKVTVLSGIFAFVSGAVASNAHDSLYTDENVSLSTAIDRYIASGTDILETEYSVNVQIGESTKCVLANEAKASETDAASDTGSELKAVLEITAVPREENEPETEEVEIEDNQTVAVAESDNQETYNFFSGKAIVVASDYVNIRKGAGTDNEIIATILPDGIIRVKESGSEWTCIVSAGLEGYIKNDYLLFGNEAADYAMANLDDINATYNAIMAKPVEETTSDNNGGQTNDNSTSQTPASSGSGVGTDIANFALQYVGYPYVYGGTSLTNGADCSGFVMTVYKNFGYSLPRTADDQSLVGVEVSRENIQPGDLIFYDYGTGVVQHVGIYTGNGQMVHAANTRLGIISGNAFYSSVISIRRIVN